MGRGPSGNFDPACSRGALRVVYRASTLRPVKHASQADEFVLEPEEVVLPNSWGRANDQLLLDLRLVKAQQPEFSTTNAKVFQLNRRSTPYGRVSDNELLDAAAQDGSSVALAQQVEALLAEVQPGTVPRAFFPR